jgi:hypothetical protein
MALYGVLGSFGQAGRLPRLRYGAMDGAYEVYLYHARDGATASESFQ